MHVRTTILVCGCPVRTTVRQTFLNFDCASVLLECLFVVAKSAEDVAKIDETCCRIEGVADTGELLQFDGLIEVL